MAEVRRNLRKLRLLMWKHYHLRKYRYITSLVELLLPILVVYGSARSTENLMSSAGVTNHTATIPNKYTIPQAITLNDYFTCVVYTPLEQPLEDLMKRYNEYLDSIDNNPIHRTTHGVKTEIDLERDLRSHNKSHGESKCIGIIFTDFSALTGQEAGRLSYTLRSFQDVNTEDMYYMADKDGITAEGPIMDDIYYAAGFLNVQVALNEAFMKYKKKQSLYEEVNLQPFPYPEYQEENPIRSMIPQVVSMIVLFTSLILSIPLITTIVEEKTSGVKELMKIVGMQEWLVWVGWFLYALLFSSISYSVVTYMLQHEFAGPNSAAIRNVNPMVLWSCIILYCVSNIAFCFMFTAIFHQATIASSVYVLVFVLISYGSHFLEQQKFWYLRKLACLLPNAAFSLAFGRVHYSEMHDMYLGWHNLFSTTPSTLSLGYTFVMMIFDTLLYLFLVYYISAVNPGKFGARKSPFFIFDPLKSAMKKHQPQELVNLEDPPVDKFIEKPPSNLEATIKIKDLHKNFGSVYAVKGVNLNVYKGEITALLGHNGAGKTTTLAILTGILKPTDGSIVYKDKLDVLKRMDEFRQNLGMCAQEDRLFPYLTVLDHLLFFGQLKGETKQEAMKEAKEYMNLMGIADKANSLVASLSGGMKRKLCLSIALMGKAETLILDEPTSGLDVESRRKLWDLLLEMRGHRTIILTTHHMEEADVLGDRIAIMHHGTIVCHGTSLYLKKSYNTGYQLTITKSENVSELPLTTLLQNSEVANVSVESLSPTEVTYKLPLTETSKFAKLFGRLEANRTKLGIGSIGLSCTTMEQVFLKVGGVSMYDAGNLSRKGSTVTDGGTVSHFVYNKSSGPVLIAQQIYALLHKKLLYTSRNWLNFFFKVILPTLIMIAVVQGGKKTDHSAKSLRIDFAAYPNTKVMVQNTSDSWPYWKDFQSLLRPHNIEFIASEGINITDGLLKYGRENIGSFKHDIILAMERNGVNFTLLYNRFALHSLPLGLSVFGDYFTQYRDKNQFEFVMSMHPLSEMTETCSLEPNEENSINLLLTYFIVLAFYTIDLNTYFMTAINVERVDGFKHIQLMSNVSPVTYWLSNFIFDYVLFFAIILARIVVLKIVNDENEFLAMDTHFCALMSIFAVFIASCLVFTYVVSYLSNSKDGSYVLLFIINIFGGIVVAVVYMIGAFFKLESLETTTTWLTVLYQVVQYVILLCPPMNYCMIFIKFFYTWNDVRRCPACKHSVNFKERCENISYLGDVKKEMLFLVFDTILYAALLSIIQLGYFEKLVNMAVIKIYGTSVTNRGGESEKGDGDVQLEKATVDQLTASSPGNRLQSEILLVAHQLRKNFIKLFRPFTAVADVNFTVKTGECFGLLGVNGAGKSTTFRMLTGDLLSTKGNSFIMNFSLREHRTKYLSRAGYCAQSNCFLEELSGREMLTLVASLRGIRSTQLENVVDKWLTILGLEEYQNQRCGGYSGGNKRKLCTAMSLIGDPNVVFLDEPTSGVDPVARRRLYGVMQQSRESGQAVVLTSHSMEECENLCDRLTILVKGQMRCIGTAQHLKQTYAQGFTILVKVEGTATSDALKTLKTRIENEFNQQCVLKDEHKTQLYYQITDTRLLWSTLFEKMEKLKNENKHVLEDYILSDTSLEEVFISFAKQNA